MRLFPPPLQIDSEEGFTPQKDLFGRKTLGDGLISLVSSVTDPMVIALDGQWGSGKTTFLQMWAGELRKNGFPVVWFDAFEHDYADDAFAAIAGEIISLATKVDKSRSKGTKRFVKTAKDAGRILARAGIGVGLRVATAGMVDATALTSIGSDISDEISKATDKILDDLLTSRVKEKGQLDGFREALSLLPQSLNNTAAVSTNEKIRPLILIIDELDRCRPHFSLQVLERIKHFFSVQNVHFVLGAHLGQLANSVKVAYGADIDARTYLQKFIHITVQLGVSAERRRDRVEAKYVHYLRNVMEFSVEDRETVDYTTQLIEYLAIRRELSLRAVERVFTYLALALAYTPKNHFRPQAILGPLCVLKVVSPVLYEAAKKGTLKYDEMVGELLPGSSPENDSTDERLKKWWRLCTGMTSVDEPWAASVVREMSFNYDFENIKELIPYVANDLIDRLAPR